MQQQPWGKELRPSCLPTAPLSALVVLLALSLQWQPGQSTLSRRLNFDRHTPGRAAEPPELEYGYGNALSCPSLRFTVEGRTVGPDSGAVLGLLHGNHSLGELSVRPVSLQVSGASGVPCWSFPQDLTVWLRRGSSDVNVFAEVLLQHELSVLDMLFGANLTPGTGAGAGVGVSQSGALTALVAPHLRASPTTILDLGGNCGMSALHLALRFPGATIVSVEPEMSNHHMLVLNTGHLVNVHQVQAAVSGTQGMAEMSSGHKGPWGFHLSTSKWDVTKKQRKAGAPPEGNLHLVHILTVPFLMRKYGWQRIDFMKIDIEGAERALFDSASDLSWLPRVGCLAIETHEWASVGSSLNFHQAMRDYNFERLARRGEKRWWCRTAEA